MKRLFVILWLAGMAIGTHAEVLVQPDCPGEGVTSTTVLDRGAIQWETWLDVNHIAGAHLITLPNTLFRLGVGPWAELRLEYTGSLVTWDHPEDLPGVAKVSYVPDPLAIGTKICLWRGSEDLRLRWIPRTAILANLRLPISYEYVDPSSTLYRPISGSIEVGFENDLTDWLTLGYGVYLLAEMGADAGHLSLRLFRIPTHGDIRILRGELQLVLLRRYGHNNGQTEDSQWSLPGFRPHVVCPPMRTTASKRRIQLLSFHSGVKRTAE